jgi:hypothetical protein
LGRHAGKEGERVREDQQWDVGKTDQPIML